jgi:hypothetical protein
MVDYGVAWTIKELYQVIADLGVNHDNVGIDSANWSSEVYQYVIDSGKRWKAVRGDKASFFKEDGVRSVWTWTEVDPYSGTSAEKTETLRLLLFSSSGAKDKLASYMHAIQGFASWEIAQDVCDTYLAEMTAEEREETVGRGGVVEHKWVQKRKDNHNFDVEQILMIMAEAKGLIYVAPPKEEKPANAAQPDLFPVEQDGHKGPYVGPDGKTHYVLR